MKIVIQVTAHVRSRFVLNCLFLQNYVTSLTAETGTTLVFYHHRGRDNNEFNNNFLRMAP